MEVGSAKLELVLGFLGFPVSSSWFLAKRQTQRTEAPGPAPAGPAGPPSSFVLRYSTQSAVAIGIGSKSKAR
jgi:hypothetical protein